MSTYVVGDVQGCYDSLRNLVDAITFDPDRDELWLAGDLVNRGPASADVLRWARDHDSSVRAVLGNHDLYLLARALSVIEPSRSDTLGDIFDAPDADALVTWLRHRPLIHRDGPWVMVHAALHPSWTVAEAQAVASDIEAVLRGPEAAALLSGSFGEAPTRWRPEDPEQARRLAGLAVMTRLRCLSPDGQLTFDYTGTLDSCPADRIPWWRAPHGRREEFTVVIGHWAALGYHREPGLLATDTGCAWGRSLTAVCLEDGAVTQVAADGSVSRSCC